MVLKIQRAKKFVKLSAKFQISYGYDCSSSAINLFPKGSEVSQWEFLVVLGSYSVNTKEKPSGLNYKSG